MPDMIVEWRIAGWAENMLIVLLGIGVAALAVWLVLQAVKDVLDREARVETLRAQKAEKALEEWMQTFREEHELRIAAEKKAQQERNMRKQIAKGANNAGKKTT